VDGPLPGVPAITRNRFGEGTAWYIATNLDKSSLKATLREAAGVTAGSPENVEIVRRHKPGKSYVFLLNHGATEIEYPVTGTDLISGERADGCVRVRAGGVRVLLEEEGTRP
jgi:beta-galactosidase